MSPVGAAGTSRLRGLYASRRDFFVWADTRPWFRPLVVALVSLAVALLVTPERMTRQFSDTAHLLGTPSLENIKSPFDLEVVDTETTERLRDEALAQVRRVYDHDVLAAAKSGERLGHAFALARAMVPEHELAPVHREDDEAVRQAFERGLGQPLRANELQALRAGHFARELELGLRQLLVQAASRPIIASRVGLEPDRERGLAVQRVPADAQPVAIFENIEQVADLEGVRQDLLEATAETPRPVLRQLVARLLEANLTFNRAETELQRAAAQAAVKPVSIAIKKGEMVVRDGERFSARQLMILQALSQNNRQGSLPLVAAGGGLLFLVLLATASRFIGGHGRQRLVLSSRDLLFLASLFVGGLAACRVGLLVAHILHESHARLPLGALLLLLPTAAGAMMVRLVLRTEVAVLFALLNSCVLGLMADSERMLSLYAALGAIASISLIRTISARSDLLRAGVWAGAAQMVCALGLHLLQGEGGVEVLLMVLPAAFSGGLLAGLVALALTPIVEWAFNYSTDLKLLELSNLNHPALKELIVQAPGSYHHSIIVGALVEAAAESIGANPLLARVMAYYHDLGKGCNPVYFVENQRSHHNPHDKLKPSMSAMIIRRHVTDGIELAKQYALGEPILAGIAQHHGTTLIHYFYHKAREQAADSDSVSEAEYRYPGQKPQTREAALVMVGDSIEAAARSLSDPTPARLQGLVTRIISHKFTDGQLEECDLTLRDLHTIAKAFSRVLTSIYHHRVEYPDMLRPVSGRKASVDSDHKPKRGTEAAHTPSAQDPPDNLRRLGL